MVIGSTEGKHSGNVSHAGARQAFHLKGFGQEVPTPCNASSATGAFQWDCWAGLAFLGCKLGFERILLEKPFNV